MYILFSTCINNNRCHKVVGLVCIFHLSFCINANYNLILFIFFDDYALINVDVWLIYQKIFLVAKCQIQIFIQLRTNLYLQYNIVCFNL